jgi:hypothetical protein
LSIANQQLDPHPAILSSKYHQMAILLIYLIYFKYGAELASTLGHSPGFPSIIGGGQVCDRKQIL